MCSAKGEIVPIGGVSLSSISSFGGDGQYLTLTVYNKRAKLRWPCGIHYIFISMPKARSGVAQASDKKAHTPSDDALRSTPNPDKRKKEVPKGMPGTLL